MSTTKNNQEKVPLLPITTEEEECQRLECYKNKCYKKKFKFISILFVLVVIYFNFNNNNKVILEHEPIPISSYETAQDLATTNDILAFNENQMSTQVYYFSGCRSKPSIPFSGISKFEFDTSQFTELSIGQKTNRNGRNSVILNSGEAVIKEDKSVSKATVDFDIRFDTEDLQDVYWIEKEQDVNRGIYALTIKSDGSTYSRNACVTIDIIIRVPEAKSLKKLGISLSNSDILLKNELIFDELALATANGHIDFSEGISSGKTGLVVANGHVSGTIDTLSDELHVSIGNGRTDIVIKEIKGEKIPLEIKSSNGRIDLQVPSNFNSQFNLKSSNGKRTIESSIPQNIHRRSSGGWGKTTGYYGNNEFTKNSISLTAANGALHLTYA